MTVHFDSETRPKRDDESFLEYYLYFRGNEIEPGSAKAYRVAWGALEQFLEEQEYTLDEVAKEEVLEWCEYLRSKDIKEGYAEQLVGRVRQMVNDLKKTPEVSGGNPFQEALNTDPFSYDDTTTKLEVSLNSIRVAIFNIGNPVTLFIFVMLLKTGLRCSELVNLDERDINIDHPISEALDPPRPEIRDKPNTIYVDSSISEGDKVNGEIRKHGNKPKSYREIPLDKETVKLLVWYLALAPSSNSPANPIMKILGAAHREKKVGDRLGYDGIHKRIKTVAHEYGWDVEGGVTSHWCRHWFTTQLRARIDDDEVPVGSAKEYVQGLRGDTDDSVIDTYTQDWNIDNNTKSYPEVYRDNIPELFVNPVEDNEITCPTCGREPPAVAFSTLKSNDEGKLCNPCARDKYVTLD